MPEKDTSTSNRRIGNTSFIILLIIMLNIPRTSFSHRDSRPSTPSTTSGTPPAAEWHIPGAYLSSAAASSTDSFVSAPENKYEGHFTSTHGRWLARHLPAAIEEYERQGKLSSSLDGVFQEHLLPLAIEMAYTIVVSTLFPAWASGRVGAMMTTRASKPLAEATIEGIRGEKKPLLSDMKKWKFVYDNVLNCKKTNDYLDRLSDPGIKNVITAYKRYIENSFIGKKTGRYGLIEPERMAKLFDRLINIMKKPENLREMNWSEKIEGMDITREQEKQNICADYPEIRSRLESLFDKITRASKGENIGPIRVVFIGSPGNGKTTLVDRTVKMFGFDSMELPQAAMADEKEIFGSEKFLLGALQDEKSDTGMHGRLPAELLTKRHKNFIIRTEDLKWDKTPIEGGIKDCAVALKFLDPDPERSRHPLNCFMPAFPIENNTPPEMDLGAAIILSTSNDFIPTATTALKAIATRVDQIPVPDMSTERKMNWAEKALSKESLPAEIKQASRNYLPFIVNADTYVMENGGIRDVNKAYAHIISQLRTHPDKSERELKQECLDILSPQTPLDINAVEEKIAVHKMKNRNDKINSARTLLEDKKDVSARTKDRAALYLAFIADTDTNDFHRSGMESVKAALDFVVDKIEDQPAAEDAAIKLGILARLALGSVIKPDVEGKMRQLSIITNGANRRR